MAHEGQAASGQVPKSNRWSAPDKDGGLLLWPEAARIIASARRNAQNLASSDRVRLNGQSLAQLRERARAFVGHAGDGPLIATGHQCELQHPGVWVKNAVICAAARKLGGAALHLAVDTDAPKHLRLAWPGFSAPITDDPDASTAAWSAMLTVPTQEHLRYLLSAAERAKRDSLVSELLPEFLGACQARLAQRQRADGPPLTLPALLLEVQRSLDRRLGLEYDATALSALLESDVWANFLLAVASQPQEFARIYNSALREHRSQTGDDSTDRPARDLLITRTRVELPFWLDELATGRRQRAQIALQPQGPMLSSPDHQTVVIAEGRDPKELASWLRTHRLRLAPRAMTLTMFVRLCLCDLFVHGIGGGLYDQVTDRIIRNWLGIEPPAIAVATATLYHPLATDRGRTSLPDLKQQQHTMAHQVLGPLKSEWLARMSSTPDRAHRREVFARMHEARRSALASDPAFGAAQQRLLDARHLLAQEAVLFDRKLFYAIQTGSRLEALIAQVSAAFGIAA